MPRTVHDGGLTPPIPAANSYPWLSCIGENVVVRPGETMPDASQRLFASSLWIGAKRII